MLRKLLVSALILLYTSSVIGLPLHFHYCSGQLKHVSLLVKLECDADGMFAVKARTCCQKEKPRCTEGECCDDATQLLNEAVPAVCLQNDGKQQVLFVVPDTGTFSEAASTESDLHTPVVIPPWSPPEIYLMQCALIFYG